MSKDQIDYFRAWVDLALDAAKDRKLPDEYRGWLDWAGPAFKNHVGKVTSAEEIEFAEAAFVIGLLATDMLLKSRQGGQARGEQCKQFARDGWQTDADAIAVKCQGARFTADIVRHIRSNMSSANLPKNDRQIRRFADRLVTNGKVILKK